MGDVAFDARLHARQLIAVREAAACTLPVQREWEEEDADFVVTDDFTFASGEVEEEGDDDILDTLLGADPDSDGGEETAEDADYLECVPLGADLPDGVLESDDQEEGEDGDDDEAEDDSGDDSSSDGSQTSSAESGGGRRGAVGRSGRRSTGAVVQAQASSSSSSGYRPSSSMRNPIIIG
eukprot:GHVU01176340.1.p2 GENE.GHVU01176340.1~~GHVU01176340.1.p2  ORF type:complete len:180 (-),score=41.92 GHVU01176340.1:642-1181(-)